MMEKRNNSTADIVNTDSRNENQTTRKECFTVSVDEMLGINMILVGRDYQVLWANRISKEGENEKRKTCFSMFHSLPEACLDCGAKKIFEDKALVDFHEIAAQDEQGNQIWMEFIAIPVKDNSGVTIGVLELILPITERKKVEQRLQENEEKFRAISNALLDAAILSDDEGRISYCTKTTPVYYKNT